MASNARTAPAPLTERVILDAALELIAEAGVEQMSMRQLSGRLGVSLGATYRHVATREELLALCARELWAQALRPRLEHEDPMAWVREQMSSVYTVVSAYPGMASYMIARIDLAQSPMAAVQQALLEAGQPPEVEEVIRLVLSFYLMGVMLAGPDIFAAIGIADPRPDIERGLDLILGPALGRPNAARKPTKGRRGRLRSSP
ncbi:MAG TPA: helix-turn-helix domain-containing protein [Mycobacteriales bacterium]|nr:helix-turn-helix domain-containing protein [Mycobacteriales bacterium]